MRLGIIVDAVRGPILVHILCNLGNGHRMVLDHYENIMFFIGNNYITEI
jgi:hypothetical protein